MTAVVNCWKCGSQLVDLIMPLSRREECRHCKADQHVCKLCKEFNPSVSGRCDEDRAEEVIDKETANFCDYFSPNPDAYNKMSGAKKKQVETELEALFGGSKPEKSDDFGVEGSADVRLEPKGKAEQALSELEKLFTKGHSDQ